MKSKGHIRYRSEVEKLKNGKGVIFPGVTTIVGILNKPALVKWANKLGLDGVEVGRFVDDKADIGTLGHAMITDHYKGVETDTSDYTKNQIDKAENAALSFWEWEKKHKIEPILIEEPLVSERMEFGGTADIYGKVDGVLELIDIKTGNGIWPEHYIQVAAYGYLLAENGYKVDNYRILNIPRAETENFREELVGSISKQWLIFAHCLSIYRLRKEIKSSEK